MAASINKGPFRIGFIEGYQQKKNEIIYHPPRSEAFVGTIIYFGGDMQDYKENMLAHRDNKYYSEWNLESSATLLHQQFPDCVVLIIKPTKMSLKTFSCFENFVEVNNFGAPTYSLNLNALKHLRLLLQNFIDAKGAEFFLSDLVSKQIILIGFSKGCVVLNQLLYSIHCLDQFADEELESFLKQIHCMYWIDGGHSGTSPTWVTDKTVLQTFSRSNIEVHIHVTPYQVQCDTRPRIGKEEKIFRDSLDKLGVKVKRELHFESEPRSLNFHFKVLKYIREIL